MNRIRALAVVMVLGIVDLSARSDVLQEFSVRAVASSAQVRSGETEPDIAYRMETERRGAIVNGDLRGVFLFPPASRIDQHVTVPTNVACASVTDLADIVTTGDYECAVQEYVMGSATSVVVQSVVSYEAPVQVPCIAGGFWSNGALWVHESCVISLGVQSNEPPTSNSVQALILSKPGSVIRIYREGSFGGLVRFPHKTVGSPIGLSPGSTYTGAFENIVVVATTNVNIGLLHTTSSIDVGIEHVTRTVFVLKVLPDPQIAGISMDEAAMVRVSGLITNHPYGLAAAESIHGPWSVVSADLSTTNPVAVVTDGSTDARFFRLQWR